MRKVKSEDAQSYVVQPLPDIRTRAQLEAASDDAIIAEAKEILAKRVRRGQALTSPDTVKDYLLLQYSNREAELFGCIFLTNQHEVIVVEELFYGTIDGASVYPREVLKRALQLNAAAVTFFHNHPSGATEPSEADLRMTQTLKTALKVVEIRVLDHIIIGAAARRPLSFAERGLI